MGKRQSRDTGEKLIGLIKVWHDYPSEYAAGALEESLEAGHNHRQVYLPILEKSKEKEFEITVSSNPNMSLTEKKKVLQECVDYLLSLPHKTKKENK